METDVADEKYEAFARSWHKATQMLQILLLKNLTQKKKKNLFNSKNVSGILLSAPSAVCDFVCC